MRRREQSIFGETPAREQHSEHDFIAALHG